MNLLINGVNKMANERSSVIKIGNRSYELLLTTKATKEINSKFGGIEKIGDKLAQSKDVGESIDLVIWLIVILANQSIIRKNLIEKKDEPVLKVEEVEVLTSPSDLNDYTDAIMEALLKGTKRNVESEEDSKNVMGE